MKTGKRGLLTIVLTATVLLGSCRLIVGTAAVTTAAVVGTVGLVGYSVYKGGEWVVKGVASVGSSTGKAVSNKRKQIVISRGTLKAKAEHTVPELYAATERVLQGSGFTGISGARDALFGKLRAQTSSGENVYVTLELLEARLTAIEIRVGDGNLKQAEFLYDQVLATVGAGAPASLDEPAPTERGQGR